MTEQEMYFKETATKAYILLGIPVNLQGFRCLVECTTMVLNDTPLLKNVTKNLYPLVAKIIEVENGVVERSMRHAIAIGYAKTRFKALGKMIGIDGEPISYKPTCSELIALIVEYIRFKSFREGKFAV